MPDLFKDPYQETFSGRCFCSLLVALSGAINGGTYDLVANDGQGLAVVIAGIDFHRQFSLPVLGAIGGGISGFLLAGYIGRLGVVGWLMTLVSAIACTFVGGALAGTFVAPMVGTIYGAIFGLVILLNIELKLIWLLCVVAVHLLVRRRSRINVQA